MSTGSDEPAHGREYPPLENATPPVDPHAPVDYPTDFVAQPPNQFPPSGFQQPGYPPPDYQQQAYPPPDYQQQPYPPSGYPPPGMPTAGYPPQYAGGYGYNPGYGSGFGVPYDPYAPARPAGTNGKAIAAMVTSLAGVALCGVPSIVGLILGVIAMRETKRTGQEGYGMALAGVIVGALSVAGWLLYVIVIVFAIAVTSTSPHGY